MKKKIVTTNSNSSITLSKNKADTNKALKNPVFEKNVSQKSDFEINVDTERSTENQSAGNPLNELIRNNNFLPISQNFKLNQKPKNVDIDTKDTEIKDTDIKMEALLKSTQTSKQTLDQASHKNYFRKTKQVAQTQPSNYQKYTVGKMELKLDKSKYTNTNYTQTFAKNFAKRDNKRNSIKWIKTFVLVIVNFMILILIWNFRDDLLDRIPPLKPDKQTVSQDYIQKNTKIYQREYQASLALLNQSVELKSKKELAESDKQDLKKLQEKLQQQQQKLTEAEESYTFENQQLHTYLSQETNKLKLALNFEVKSLKTHLCATNLLSEFKLIDKDIKSSPVYQKEITLKPELVDEFTKLSQNYQELAKITDQAIPCFENSIQIQDIVRTAFEEEKAFYADLSELNKQQAENINNQEEFLKNNKKFDKEGKVYFQKSLPNWIDSSLDNTQKNIQVIEDSYQTFKKEIET